MKLTVGTLDKPFADKVAKHTIEQGATVEREEETYSQSMDVRTGQRDPLFGSPVWVVRIHGTEAAFPPGTSGHCGRYSGRAWWAF